MLTLHPLPVHQLFQFRHVVAQIEKYLVQQFAFVFKTVAFIPFVQRYDVMRHRIFGDIPGQDFRSDNPLRGEDGNLFRHVLQLADVPRP